MKLAYFSNQFADREGHGLARYARELYRALVLQPDAPGITPVAAWSSLDKEQLARLQSETGLEILPWGQKLTPLSWTLFNRPALEHWVADIDLVHCVALGYPVPSDKPYVVTVHDIGPLTHPEFFTRKGTWIMRRSLDHAIRNADRFICVSDSTANELNQFAGGGLDDRIEVIHEGLSREFMETNGDCEVPEVAALIDRGVPYILSTGKISPRKNIARTVEALARVADSIPHHLFLAGGSGWSTSGIREQLANSGIADRVHFLGYVSDSQLKYLYHHASAYLHPSLYEGFGLTLLEAMACGCPVITSSVYSLPEVAGDAALLVDPYSVDEIAQAIVGVCTDEKLAGGLSVRGKQRASEFSWGKCAELVIKVYKSVL